MPSKPRKKGDVIVPMRYPSPEVSDELDAFLKSVGVKQMRRATYATALYLLGMAMQEPEFPSSLVGLFALAGWDSHHVHYGAFNQGRAAKAKADTARERREVLRALAKFRPACTIVDFAAPPKGGRVLKAYLTVRAGLCPVAIKRDEDDLVGALWADLSKADLLMPLVTVPNSERAEDQDVALDEVLKAAGRFSFDHFAHVSRMYDREDKPAEVRLDWPLNGIDNSSFADSLQRCGKKLGGGAARYAWVTVDGRTRYLAYGPSRLSRFYAQRERPTVRETLDVLLRRSAAMDEANLDLNGWPLEHLRPRSTARDARIRWEHAAVMASLHSLVRHGRATHNPTTTNWSTMLDNWAATSTGPGGPRR